MDRMEAAVPKLIAAAMGMMVTAIGMLAMREWSFPYDLAFGLWLISLAFWVYALGGWLRGWLGDRRTGRR